MPAHSLKKSAEARQKYQKLDPLYVIFEQHLFNFQDPDTDRKSFIGNVIADYFKHLRKLNITVPRSLEQPIIEELAAQVNTMLVKKIYGCVNLNEYRKNVAPVARKKARARYSKLGGVK
jgi:hypothetical protein